MADISRETDNEKAAAESHETEGLLEMAAPAISALDRDVLKLTKAEVRSTAFKFLGGVKLSKGGKKDALCLDQRKLMDAQPSVMKAHVHAGSRGQRDTAGTQMQQGVRGRQLRGAGRVVRIR